MTSDAADPTVAELSEGEILRRILERLGQGTAPVGPGDDAAVIDAPDARVVATVDTLVEGPDFRQAWTSGFDLGWKAAAVNLADVAAMGARPTALLVALALPEHTRISFVVAVADGLRAACAELAPGCAVEGGDLTVSRTLTVAVTALGSLDGRAPVLRSGARVGDVVALAGDAGVAARGLDVLFERFADPDGTALPYSSEGLAELDRVAVERQLRPVPPIGAGVGASLGGATAMMDVSDGLALDASRIADASGVTVALETALLGTDPRALSGGEDHALLATFPSATALPAGFRPIGSVVARGAAALTVDGAPYRGRTGWDPYRDTSGGDARSAHQSVVSP
ncbi:thiamine-phosphate kinase [Microbacterium terricola]|uniref:Thiamine-monophosphate kinase n=1 Tax=Microbacterium terricola TaxID=344163 RepID=A0ABM8DZA5_9MICO|nr:thiamine-phosphate kinase [Microbacterium terricola]UYK41341.1 thiamine-phosphate kinase [Microbacterium terricola]BDV30876.1 thiamine-monophosphate kinase [Microbacterium terricola]